MQHTTHQSEAFVRLAHKHAAELNTLAKAFDKAVEHHGAVALTQSLIDAAKVN